MTAATGTASGFRRRAGVLRHDNFRLLLFATFGSGIGNWLALIALQADLYARTDHSGWWISAVLVASVLPAIAIGLLFGPLVDRLSRKGLMVSSDLGRLVVFAALPFVSAPANCNESPLCAKRCPNSRALPGPWGSICGEAS